MFANDYKHQSSVNSLPDAIVHDIVSLYSSPNNRSLKLGHPVSSYLQLNMHLFHCTFTLRPKVTHFPKRILPTKVRETEEKHEGKTLCAWPCPCLPHGSQMEPSNRPISALPGANQSLYSCTLHPSLFGPDCTGTENEEIPPALAG